MEGAAQVLVLAEVLLALLLLSCPMAAADVECFVCSYSPRSNSSRLDACTTSNFTEDRVDIRTCSLGCEAVAVYDTNGEMESFHRNCAQRSTIITNSCEQYVSRVITKDICSCDISYCNAASSSLVFSIRRRDTLSLLKVWTAVVFSLLSARVLWKEMI